jgi:hypothetical protein
VRETARLLGYLVRLYEKPLLLHQTYLPLAIYRWPYLFLTAALLYVGRAIPEAPT